MINYINFLFPSKKNNLINVSNTSLHLKDYHTTATIRKKTPLFPSIYHCRSQYKYSFRFQI